MTTDWRRLRLALAMLASVFVVGTIGYVILGFPLLDAVYQTVTTVATVGFREVRPLDDAGKVFTIILILVGVGTALYTFSVVLETLFEGHTPRAVREATHGPTDRRNERPRHRVRLGSRRTRDCRGAQRRGLRTRDRRRRPGPVSQTSLPALVGDATEDQVLLQAGLLHARALVAALDSDAGNLFVTLSARSLRPDLFIVARARIEETEEKLRRAGADRVVNPQSIGGARDRRIRAAASRHRVPRRRHA